MLDRQLHALTTAVVAAARAPHSYCHGEDHWRGVADQALWLGQRMGWGREERVFLFAFGALHDGQRHNDDHDPEHGARAAVWMRAGRWAERLAIPSLESRLHDALVRHDKGRTTDDPLIGACWDADRSLLGRVGIEPNARYFSTARGRTFLDMVARGERVAQTPDTWRALVARALA